MAVGAAGGLVFTAVALSASGQLVRFIPTAINEENLLFLIKVLTILID
jgi:hypothetical protein